jgi:hypothetical protein
VTLKKYYSSVVCGNSFLTGAGWLIWGDFTQVFLSIDDVCLQTSKSVLRSARELLKRVNFNY